MHGLMTNVGGELVRRLIDVSPDAVLIIDPDGRILGANDGAARLLGQHSKLDLIGQTAMDYAAEPMDPPNPLELVLANGAIEGVEAKVRRPDGTIRIIEQSAAVVRDAGGHPEACVIVSRDVTEQREREEELRNALEQKEYLVREVHHRVKNNLATLYGIITVRAQSAQVPEELEHVARHILVLGRVYDKLVAREDVGKVNVRSYLHDLLDSIFSGSDFARIKRTVYAPDAELATAFVVPLGLIINELANNAVKHAFAGRMRGVFDVQIFRVPDDEGWCMRVSNTGKPFPRDVGLSEGNGFGLEMIQGLTRQLGGAVQLHKRPITEFVFRFPPAADAS